ncbi:unnamed protein product [Mytilus edulis]|uniref:Uncharacterized protein n=1 Tax=Mytilus edulis TaxID=6550 RepID=A0A8S3SE76_MYTED|nr:unnamed protein product [Mytilus edulis]
MEEFKKEKEVIVPESEIPMAEEVIVISEEEKEEEEENSMDDYMSKYVADHELEEIVTLPNEDVLENIMLVENLFNEWSDEDLETPKNNNTQDNLTMSAVGKGVKNGKGKGKATKRKRNEEMEEIDEDDIPSTSTTVSTVSRIKVEDSDDDDLDELIVSLYI